MNTYHDTKDGVEIFYKGLGQGSSPSCSVHGCQLSPMIGDTTMPVS